MIRSVKMRRGIIAAVAVVGVWFVIAGAVVGLGQAGSGGVLNPVDIAPITADALALSGRVVTAETGLLTESSRIDTAFSDALALSGRVVTAEGEIDTMQTGKVDKAGDTMTGNLTIDKPATATFTVDGSTNQGIRLYNSGGNVGLGYLGFFHPARPTVMDAGFQYWHEFDLSEFRAGQSSPYTWMDYKGGASSTGLVTIYQPIVGNAVGMTNGNASAFFSTGTLPDARMAGASPALNMPNATNFPASFDAYTIPFATSNAISLANGNLQWYAPTNTTTIYLPTGSSTTQVHSVRIDVDPGVNSFTISTNNVLFTTNEVLGAGASDVTIRTNGVSTPLIFDRAYGDVNWRVWGL